MFQWDMTIFGKTYGLVEEKSLKNKYSFDETYKFFKSVENPRLLSIGWWTKKKESYFNRLPLEILQIILEYKIKFEYLDLQREKIEEKKQQIIFIKRMDRQRYQERHRRCNQQRYQRRRNRNLAITSAPKWTGRKQ